MDFDKEYKKLNKSQKAAVDTLNGPVMVIAGPGTGKTQVLTLRIANILKNTDIDPTNILALTFTESGVKAMKERLIKLIGEQAYHVNINTFHSFANQIILENPDIFLIGSRFSVLSDLERLDTIHKILDSKKLENLKPTNAPYFFASYISRAISDLKREGITYKKYSKLTSNNQKLINKLQNQTKKSAADLKEIKNLKKQLELKEIYKEYEVEIKKIERYDFEDLINIVIEKFGKNEELLKTYQEKFQYILADEFQDTNNAQYKILKLLTSHWGETADIFTVGDDDQSIYRFQGASVENMLTFLSDFKNATVINLTKNYRSNQSVLDVSKNIIDNNKTSIQKAIPQISKNLTSAIKKKSHYVGKSDLPIESKIKIYQFSNGVLESYYVAKKIKKLIEQGENPNEIAVIYRNNSDSADISKALSKLKIKYNLQGGENILIDGHVKKFLKLLTVIEQIKSKNEDIDMFTLFNYEYLGFDYVDTLKISRFASQKRTNFFEALTHKDFIDGKVIQKEKAEKYTQFVEQTIPNWIKVNENSTFTKTFETILNESGFLNYTLEQENSGELINKINSLYGEAQTQINGNNDLKLKDFLANIEVLNSNYLKVLEKDFDIKSNSVTLTTAHKAKGLEFKHVFIYRCVNKKWGNNRNIEYIKLPEGIVKEKSGENEEERRLFYVALTRAKANIYISYSNEYSNSWGLSQADPSMFLLELPKNLIEKHSSEKLESDILIKNAQKIFLQVAKDTKVSRQESEILKSLIENYKLSVTGLNTYLSCPYKFKLNTILRTPRAKATYLSLGTAVHKAFEEYYKKYMNDDKLPNKSFLLDEYKKALNNEILTKKEREDLKEKGIKILSNYFEIYKDKFKKPEYLERLFGYGFGKVYVSNVPLVGKVDRIEVIDNKSVPKTVKVVDYKTGNEKSKNEVEGNTKYSTGNEKRQLVFYKILCDLDKTFRLNAQQFELDYVGSGKPNSKPVKHEFTISKSEVKDLKKLIIDTMKKIRSLQFDRTKDYTVCKYCDFADHCWPEGIPTSPQITQDKLFD